MANGAEDTVAAVKMNTIEEENQSDLTLEDTESIPQPAPGESIPQPLAPEESAADKGRRAETNDDNSGWIDILGNGCLLKKVYVKGDGVSTRPSPQSKVALKMIGHLKSGELIDKHNPIIFTVGDGDVVQAVDIGVTLMERGEVCQIKTDSRYAYGALGRSPDVPPNSGIIYDLELVDVKPPMDLATVGEEELCVYLNQKRGNGNNFFQRKEYPQAVLAYGRAVTTIRNFREVRTEVTSQINDLWIRCLNNLAAAQIKIELYDDALSSTEEVLKCDPDNVKALYRRGKVLLAKDELDEAVVVLKKACAISPEERAVNAELTRALRMQEKRRNSEKELYKRMITPKPSRPTGPKPTVQSSAPSSNSSSWGWKGAILGAGITVILAVGVVLIYSKYRK